MFKFHNDVQLKGPLPLDDKLENLITKSIRNFINTFKSYLSIHLNKATKFTKK